jgi:hypothetical protein
MIPTEFDNTLVGTELGDIGRLRQIASNYCPEEIRKEVRPLIPDGVDALNLDELKEGFMRLISGGDGFPELKAGSLTDGFALNPQSDDSN